MPPAMSLQPADPRVINWVVVVPSAATSGLKQTHVRRDVQDAPTESTVHQNQQVPDHLQVQKEWEEGPIKEEQEERCIKEVHEEHRIKEEYEEHCIKEHKEFHIKEEHEERCTKKEHEGRCINGEAVEVNLRIKEADTRFPLTSVLVKNENDDKICQSPQLHQSPAEKHREAALPNSRPGKRMKTQTEDHGGRKQARNSDLNSCLAPNTDEKDLDFTETEDNTEDNDHGDTYWQEPISTSGSSTEDSSSDEFNLQGPLSESQSDTEVSSRDDSKLQGPLSESGSDTEDSSSDDNRQETSSLQKHIACHSGKKSSEALGSMKPSTNGQRQFHTREKHFHCKICRRVLDKSRLLKMQRTPQSGRTVCNFCEKKV